MKNRDNNVGTSEQNKKETVTAETATLIVKNEKDEQRIAAQGKNSEYIQNALNELYVVCVNCR